MSESKIYSINSKESSTSSTAAVNVNNLNISEVLLSIVDDENNRRYSLQVQDRFFLQEFKFHVAAEASDCSLEIDIREFTRILNIAEERRERFVGVSARSTISDTEHLPRTEDAVQHTSTLSNVLDGTENVYRWQSMSESLAHSLETDSGLFFAVAKEAYEISRNPFQRVLTEDNNLQYHYNINNNSICCSSSGNSNNNSMNSSSNYNNRSSIVANSYYSTVPATYTHERNNSGSVYTNNSINNNYIVSTSPRNSNAQYCGYHYNGNHGNQSMNNSTSNSNNNGVVGKVSYACRLMMGSNYITNDFITQEQCERQYISSPRKHCAAFRLCANVFARVFNTKVKPKINTCNIRRSFRLAELMRFRRAVREGFSLPHDDPTSYATRSVSNLEIKWIRDNIHHDAYFFPKSNINSNNNSNNNHKSMDSNNDNNNVNVNEKKQNIHLCNAENAWRASSNDVTLSYMSHQRTYNIETETDSMSWCPRENETQTFGFTKLLSNPTWEVDTHTNNECRVCKATLKSISHPWGISAHHCRCCGRRLCGQCIYKRAHKSFAKLSKPGYPIEGEERLVCNQCYEEYLTLEKLRYLGALFALAGFDFSHLSLCRTVSQQWRQAAELCLSEYRYLLHTCEADFHSILTPVGLFLQNSIALIVNDNHAVEMGEPVVRGMHPEAALLLLKFIAEEHLWNEPSTLDFLNLLTQRSLKGGLSFSHWHFYCTAACRNMRPLFFYLSALERLCTSGATASISLYELQHYIYERTVANSSLCCEEHSSFTESRSTTSLSHYADNAHTTNRQEEASNDDKTIEHSTSTRVQDTKYVILNAMVYMTERIKHELMQIKEHHFWKDGQVEQESPITTSTSTSTASATVMMKRHNKSTHHTQCKQDNEVTNKNENNVTESEKPYNAVKHSCNSSDKALVAMAEVEFTAIRLMDMLDMDAKCINVRERKYQLVLELLLPHLAVEYPQIALLLLIHTSLLDTRCVYDSELITAWHERIQHELAHQCSRETYTKITATVHFFTQLNHFYEQNGLITSTMMVQWVKEYCATLNIIDGCDENKEMHQRECEWKESVTNVSEQTNTSAPATLIDLPHPIMHPFKPHITLRAISLTGIQVEQLSSSRPLWLSFSTFSHTQRVEEERRQHSLPSYAQNESEAHDSTQASTECLENVANVVYYQKEEKQLMREIVGLVVDEQESKTHQSANCTTASSTPEITTAPEVVNQMTSSQMSSSTLYSTLINSPISPPLIVNNTETAAAGAIVASSETVNNDNKSDIDKRTIKQICHDDISNDIINIDNSENTKNIVPTETKINEEESQEQEHEHEEQEIEEVEEFYSFLYKRENVERDQLMCISYRLLQLFLRKRIGSAKMCNYSVLPISEKSGLIEKANGYELSRLPGVTNNVDIATFIKQRGNDAYNNFYASAKLFLLLSYIFSIADRHQGNVMISSEGAILHIDFAFIFSEKTFMEKLAGTTLRVDSQFLAAIAACRQRLKEQSEEAQQHDNKATLTKNVTKHGPLCEESKNTSLKQQQQQNKNKNEHDSCKSNNINIIKPQTATRECESEYITTSNTSTDATCQHEGEQVQGTMEKNRVNNIKSANTVLEVESSALQTMAAQSNSAEYDLFFDEAAEWFLVVRSYAEVFFQIWLYAVHRNCLPFNEYDLSVMFNTLFDRNASRKASAFNFANTMRYSINVCRLKDVTHSSVQVLRNYANKMSRSVTDGKIDAMRNINAIWNKWFKSREEYDLLKV